MPGKMPVVIGIIPAGAAFETGFAHRRAIKFSDKAFLPWCALALLPAMRQVNRFALCSQEPSFRSGPGATDIVLHGVDSIAMEILPCTRGHIPAVVELLTERAVADDAERYAALTRYWEEIYFDNPWYDPELPSLVCEGSNGQLEGFYGAMPRPMVFNERPVRAVAASNFWVRGEAGGVGNPLLAMKMMKKFLAGPQDLSVANGAAWPSRKIWEACGGVAVPVCSFDWLRPIRPAQALVELVDTQRGRPTPRGLRRVAAAADFLGFRLIQRYLRNQEATYTLEQLEPRVAVDMVACTPGFELRPQYDAASFGWLLDMCRVSGVNEGFRAAAVRGGARSDAIGLFVYLQHRDKVGQVVQLMAAPGHLATVLCAAITDASAHGIVLLRGEVDPAADLQAYRDTACLVNTGRWTLVHARQPGLIEAFIHGRALFTSLDGERWLMQLGRPGVRSRPTVD
jgi:hypothetical protein